MITDLVTGEKRKAQKGEPLTEEEFKEIKELLFRGETKIEITNITGRSGNVIDTVEATNDIKEYFILKRKLYAEYVERMKQKNGGSVKKTVLAQNHVQPMKTEAKPYKYSERYARLKEFRENLDEVLIYFIKGETEENHKDLIEANNRMEQEIVQLKSKIIDLTKELESLREPEFIQKLRGAGTVSKAVIPHMTGNQRAFFYLDEFEANYPVQDVIDFRKTVLDTKAVEKMNDRQIVYLADIGRYYDTKAILRGGENYK